ncbi:MAG TPA: anion permease [Gemmataceae bacterium]|jgi:PiT family inorganic phosphate transporter|nr:anion permease [Gemmataceae bacterium]
MLLAAIIVGVLFLAFANGANDNFKGVATLFGSGTARYSTAVIWATITTVGGSMLALALASELVSTFKGKGLVPDAVTADVRFLLSVGLGAAITVILATVLGLPVSTTHALTGGLVGAGLFAADGNVRFSALRDSFVFPLLFAPIASMLLAVVLYPVARTIRRWTGVTAQTCVCVGGVVEEVTLQPDGTLMLVRTGLAVTVATGEECRTHYSGRVAGVNAGLVLDAIHYLSAGAVCFARGLNDTPKLVALLIAAQAIHPLGGLTAVAAVMAIGGILGARRVAETMGKKITRMTPGQGLTANLVTAAMVLGASRLGLPVSTTHVSVGALFGIGTVTGTARAKTVLSILIAWITTLPLGAAMAALVYLLAGFIPS